MGNQSNSTLSSRISTSSEPSARVCALWKVVATLVATRSFADSESLRRLSSWMLAPMMNTTGAFWWELLDLYLCTDHCERSEHHSLRAGTGNKQRQTLHTFDG
jgi:hypothetical protein